MTESRLIRRIALAALLGIAACSTAQAAQTKVLFNVFTPPSSAISSQVIEPWLKDIERVTEGRVKMVTPPQSLAPPPEQLNMVKTGVADGAFQFNAFLQKSHPLLQIGFLPGTMYSGVADAVAMWRTYEKFFAAKKPFKEAKLLGFIAAPPAYIYNMNKTPIQSLADLHGKKMWSSPGIAAQAMGLTGATVVPGPAVRMYEIISKGVVDAFCCVEYGDLEAFKVLQYIGASTEIEGGVFAANFSVFISKAKWNSISPKDQAAIMKVSGEALARRSIGVDKHGKEAREKYLKSGGVVAPATPAFSAELKKAWAPLAKEWIARADKEGVDGKAALAYYISQVKKVAAGQ